MKTLFNFSRATITTSYVIVYHPELCCFWSLLICFNFGGHRKTVMSCSSKPPDLFLIQFVTPLANLQLPTANWSRQHSRHLTAKQHHLLWEDTRKTSSMSEEEEGAANTLGSGGAGKLPKFISEKNREGDLPLLPPIKDEITRISLLFPTNYCFHSSFGRNCGTLCLRAQSPFGSA